MNCLRIFTSGLLFLFVSQILLANASPWRRMDDEEAAVIKAENEADDAKSMRKFRKINNKKSWNPSDSPSDDETWLEKFLEDEKADVADLKENDAESADDEVDDEQSKKPEATDDENDDQDQNDEEVEERKFRKNGEAKTQKDADNQDDEEDAKPKRRHNTVLVKYRQFENGRNRKNRKQVLPQNEPCFNYPYCYKGLQGE